MSQQVHLQDCLFYIHRMHNELLVPDNLIIGFRYNVLICNVLECGVLQFLFHTGLVPPNLPNDLVNGSIQSVFLIHRRLLCTVLHIIIIDRQFNYDQILVCCHCNLCVCFFAEELIQLRIQPLFSVLCKVLWNLHFLSSNRHFHSAFLLASS